MLSNEFYQVIRRKLGHDTLSQGFVDGCEIIAKTWVDDGGRVTDRYLAYVMATAYLETAFKMQPIEEYGKGRGKNYGQSINGISYYGRGFPQLTWLINYQKASDELGVDLINNPNLALDPVISAKVLILGMKQGWFTGKKLSDYNDFKSMRRVVNGTDKAATIAEYAEVFNEALKASAGVAKDDGVVEMPVKPASQSTTIIAGGTALIIEVSRQAKDALATAEMVKGQLTEITAKLQTQSTLSLIMSLISIALVAYMVWERYNKPDIKKGGV